MKLDKKHSEGKPCNVWICECGTATPIKKGLPEPVCEYCRRIKESKEWLKMKQLKCDECPFGDVDCSKGAFVECYY